MRGYRLQVTGYREEGRRQESEGRRKFPGAPGSHREKLAGGIVPPWDNR